jgi:hypothetical protein
MMNYRENQKFKEPAIWIGLTVSALVVIGIFGLGFYRQIIQGRQFGNNPMSDNGLTVAFALVVFLFLSVFLLFGFAKLTIEIDRRRIAFRFFPFHFKFQQIGWDKIEKFEVITYKPIRDYGGWGIKFGKKGKAYNVAGDKGLQLQLKSGKNILIGTQKAAELSDFLSKLQQQYRLK